LENETGFSLLELLVAMLITVVITVAFLSTCTQFQDWTHNFTLILARDDNLRMVPLLLSRYLLPAANQGWQSPLSPIVIGSEVLEVRSDVDGPHGFPDHEFISPFEEIALRVQTETLQLRSGKGSFQPLLKNIQALEAVVQRESLLSMSVTASTDNLLRGPVEAVHEPITLDFYLPNYRLTLFPECPQ
jgi:hypothetical protein